MSLQKWSENMKKRIIKSNDVSPLDEASFGENQGVSQQCHRDQQQSAQQQLDAVDYNKGEQFFPGGRATTNYRRSRTGGRSRVAFYYMLIAIAYSVSFLSNTSFLQTKVAAAFGFQFPKLPRLGNNDFEHQFETIAPR